jgi:hypothetical protein
MRKLLLGAVLCVAFGLPVYGAGLASEAATSSVKHPAKRLACHWVIAGDHTLKLLRYTVEPVSRTASAPVDRPIRHLSSTAAPAAKSSTREPAVRIARTEPIYFDRQPGQRISLMVGIGY